MVFAEFDWSIFTQYVVNGLAFGAMIALVALGYTMVYGIIGLINFAHGDVFMLGAFLCGTLLEWYAPRFAASTIHLLWFAPALLLICCTFTASLNWSINALVYQPLRTAPKLVPLVSAIGVSFILQNVGLIWGGPTKFTLKNQVVLSNATLWGDDHLRLRTYDVLNFSLVIPLMLGLVWMVGRTKLGKGMRAVQQNPVAAELMGIPVERIIGRTFLIGGALAGAAGVINAMTIGTNYYQNGYQFGLFAFTAAVLGGIGSIPGAVLGGFLIGFIRAMSQGYLAEEWANTVIFGILVVILVFRPAGLLGRTVREKV